MEEKITVVHHPGPSHVSLLQLVEGEPPESLNGTEMFGLRDEDGAPHPASTSLCLRSRGGPFSDLERTSLTILDPQTRRLHLFEVDFFPSVVIEKRGTVPTPEAFLDSKEHRQLVVKELGTWKRQKLLKRSGKASAPNVSDELHLAQAIESQAEASPAEENARLSRLRALLPPFNPYAANPKGIYKLSSLLPAKDLEMVDAGVFAEHQYKAHPVVSRMAEHAGVSPKEKPQNWQRYFALMQYAISLFGLRRIRGPLRDLARRNGLELGVVRALAERFWEAEGDALVLGQFQRFRLAAFIAVLALLLFGLECHVEDLRLALHLRPRELSVLLRSIGCITEERQGVRVCRLSRIKC